MIQLFRPLPCLFVLAALAGASSDAFAARHKETQHEKKAEAARHERKDTPKKEEKAKKDAKKAKHAEHSRKRHKKARDEEKSAEKDTPKLTGDAAIVKNVIELSRQAKTSDATDAAKAISDPAAQKLAEWFILRHPDSLAHFQRYVAFISDNPEWPGTILLRRRAEAHLWQEKADAATVHAFTSDQPLTAKGRFALARTLLGEGDRDGAQRMAKATFRSEELSERAEADVLEVFRDMFDRDDYQARMDKMIGAKDMSAAMRAARRVGDDAVAIVKACSAVKGSDDKAADRLDSVAADAKGDLGYVLCRVQWLMRKEKFLDASRVVLAASAESMALQDTDEWWRVRRILARKLLDQRDSQTAYDVVRAAAPPTSENYRGESRFMPGWIALRYLNDAKTALSHFAHIDDGSVTPTTLARASYWRGRATEALGDRDGARAHYEAAASHTTAYYGQLARARLGLETLELRAPPPDPAGGSRLKDQIVRAAEMLYAIGEREVAVAFAADLGGDSTDVATLSAVAEVTGRNNDARAMLELGKTALARGLAVDHYAFPTIGIPPHTQFGQPIDRSIIYSVARTESAFNQRDRSSANAVGLMQVTPEAGRDTAKRFGVEYDWDKLVSDPVYNTQMGAAELSALLSEYKGSLIMTFAGYNAGRGRVRDWVKAYGDPRDPNVDPVDWAERIPFSETRNYVQRVMENLLVYKHRFGSAPEVAKTNSRPAVAQDVVGSVPVP